MKFVARKSGHRMHMLIKMYSQWTNLGNECNIWVTKPDWKNQVVTSTWQYENHEYEGAAAADSAWILDHKGVTEYQGLRSLFWICINS